MTPIWEQSEEARIEAAQERLRKERVGRTPACTLATPLVRLHDLELSRR